MITRTEMNQTFNDKGELLSETVVEVDITAQVVEVDLRDRVHARRIESKTEIDALVEFLRTDVAVEEAQTERDAAKAIIDNPSSTAAQKNAARVDLRIALVKLQAARFERSTSRTLIAVLRHVNALSRLALSELDNYDD